MKRTMSKALAWLLTLLMLLTAMPVSGLSEAVVQPETTAEAAPIPATDAPQETEAEQPLEEGALSENAPVGDAQPALDAPAQVASLLPGNPSVARVVAPDEGKYLTYKFYNGSDLISTQIVKEGDTLYAPEVTAGAHQKFTGWQPSVSFGTVGAIEETKTIEVHAQFEEVYYVFFKDNNGRVIKTVEGKTGDVISAANVSFHVGSDESITGWTGSGYDIAADGSVTIADDDITLTAVVTKGHWITFDSKGGTYVAPQFVTGATQKPADPTRAGYTFAGWQLNGSAFTFGGTLTDNIALEAAWTAKTNTSYTVIHWQENANDDKYSFKESETKTGTTGGQTSASAKSYQGFTAQTVEQKTIAGDGSTIVNVYYKRNVYEVKFYSYSGWSTSSQEYTSLRITAKHGAFIGDKWPTYNGSNTWSLEDNGSRYQVYLEAMPLGGASFYGPKTDYGSETAYYYVEVLPGESGTYHNGVTYKLHHSDTSPGTGYTVSQNDKYDITGFTYKEGTSNGRPYKNAKFYYTRNSYKINFINNGTADKTVDKKFEESIANAYYTPTAPASLKDYTFDGWYENELCEGSAYDFTGKTMPAQNITLYAKWNVPTYTVTFHNADGTTKPVIVIKNETVKETDAPAPAGLQEGESFLGWVIGSTEGTPFNFNTEINENYDLYAKVGDGNEYTVTYLANGGMGTVTDETKYSKDAHADVKSAAGLTAPTGKVFLGWSASETAETAEYHPGDKISMAGGNVTLYAVWGDQAQSVELTYHANGGEGAVIKESYPNNTLVALKGADAFTRTGYTLTGWNTESDGTGTFFATGASARVDNIGSNDLYAVWTINEYAYTIEYYIDGQKDDSLTVSGKADYNTAISTYPDKCPSGYVLDKTENLPLTIGTNESANVIKVYYKKNVFTLTIHYVYAEGGAAADGYSAQVTFNTPYSVDSPAIDGYTVDKETVSGTMPASDVVETVTYTKRNDLTYTVNYYWNGTTEKVAESKTVNEQTFNASVTEDPIAVNGFTVVDAASQELTITTGEDVINFYYYKNVELTANSKTETYNGAEQSVSGFTGAPEGADFSAITVGAKGTDAGKYDAAFAEGTVGTVDGTKKYIVTKATDGQLVIEKRAVTLTSGSDEKVYDGTPLTNDTVNVTGFATGEGATFDVTGTITNVGEADNTFTYTLNANTKASNYEITKNEGKLEVTPVTGKVTVTITEHSGSETYDGTEKTVTGYDVAISNALYTERDFTFSGDATVKGTDAGSYDMMLKPGDFKNMNANFMNVEFVIVDGQLKIEKRAATFTGETGTKGYTGSEQELTGIAADNLVTGHKYDGLTYSAKGTDAGEYNGAFSGELVIKDAQDNDVTANYKVTKTPGKLTITKAAQLVVKVTGNTDTLSYNGKTQSVEGFTHDAPDDVTVSLKEDKAAKAEGMDAGRYPMGLTAEDFTATSNNYDTIAIEVADGWLKIDPISIEGNVTLTTQDVEKMYDGQTYAAGKATAADSLGDGSKLTIEYSVDGENWTTDNETITAKDVADSKTVQVRVSGSNYTGYVTDTEKLTITKRAVTLTSGSDEKVYDGTPLTNGNVIVTGDGFATGEGAAYDVTGTITDIGEVDNTFAYTLNENTKADNYTIAPEYGTLKITAMAGKVTVTITEHSGSAKYDGTEKAVTGYDVAISNALYTERDFEFSGDAAIKGTDAGSYDMMLKPEDFKNTNANFTNVEFVIVDGQLKIEKRAVTLTSESDKKVYDGTPLTKPGVTVAGDGFVDGEVLNISATGTITDVGKAPNTIETSYSDKFKAGNYKITKNEGELEITAMAGKVTVTITEHSGSAKYDGTEKTVTGYDVAISNDLYGRDDFTFSGDATVKGTDAGSYDMMLKPEDFKNTNANFTNVEFVIVDGQLKIEKRTVTLTSESGKKVYDGTPLTNDTVTVTGDGFAAGEGAAYDVTGKQTDVGKSANTFGYTLNAGTKAGNYSFKKETGTLEVTPVTDEVVVTIKGNEATYEYDATEKIVTGYKTVSISNSLYKEADFSLIETAKAEARGVDAGSYLMGLTALSFVNNSKNFVNVKFVVEDGELTITRRGSGDMKVTVTANDNKVVYDGKAHGENGHTAANLVEGHSVKSVVIDGSRIDAGLYKDELVPHDAIIVDAKGNDVTKNYALTYVAGDLEIIKRGIPDDPENPDDPKLVKIIANGNKAEYDGKAHGENGYTATNLAEGQSVKSALVSGSKTDAGLYKGALVPSNAIIVDAMGNDVTKNYALTYVAGDLEITGRAATVTANDNKGILYDGKAHGGNGYTSAGLLDGHTVTGVVIDGEKIDAGLYEDALVPRDAMIVDENGNDVSGNYEVTYVAGDLEITPIMDEIVVKITGHLGYFIYDGTRKTLMGYDVKVSDPSYALDNIVFTGWARVHGIEPGIYMMGLKEDQFHDKGNYGNVKFIVVDGVMTIVRGKHYVAWLHDTSTMINSAEKSDTLTAISNYIERTKLQTVFHSGNVVADPASQAQWDAFNDTMKHLYNNERRTFIVNGAAQDTVENSLFLDQPFRDDYLESDMFEEGLGVVNRFEMGGIPMIMITLGDDALTEEGLKWARDKFNAESDRVGILMVNTYLTEDKKIAESAEEIEKQIVSVCGNVRLVLSSNAEYNSHESFKYGERTVWALNADIEEATAQGYITLLEFDADTRSLYVTTYSPVKNDFVYDDKKLEYEQFTLYNAF